MVRALNTSPRPVRGPEGVLFDPDFNDPSANIILKSSNDIYFRVHDYHLKANSGFFCDMVSDSRFASSVDKPIVMEERNWDLKPLFIIIAGHPCAADDHCYGWEKVKTLYLLMQKYQLDRLQPWFSKLAGRWAEKASWEALCLACNNHCFDEDLARYAILCGIEERTMNDLFNRKYFVHDQATKPEKDQKRRLLHPFNTKVEFSIDLGFKGWVAYCKSFSSLAAEGEVDWQRVAALFIDTVRDFEDKREISVGTPCL